MKGPAFGLILAGVVAGIACTPASTPAPAQNADATPQYGGFMHIPARPDFISKDPYQGGAGSERNLKAYPVYEPLVTYRYEPGIDYRIKNEIVPWLAEKWEQRGPADFVFTLKQGVKWQDGREFTADDVVYTIQRVLDPKFQYRQRADWVGIKEAVAEGPNQVRISLKGPDPEFVAERLTDKVMVPKHMEAEGKALDKNSMGTGAFSLTTLDTSKGLSFDKNANYWMPGLPYLDGLVVHRGLDDSAMLAAMNTGQLDLYNPDGPLTAAQMQTLIPGLGIGEYSYDYNNTVFMHLDRAPFSDIRFRRALHLGLDRQKLIALAMGGKGSVAVPGTQPHSPTALSDADLAKIPGLNPQTREQDLREAKRLLTESGYNGARVKLAYAPNLTSSKIVAEPVASLWRQDLGVQVDLEPLESATFESRRVSSEYEMMLTTVGSPPLQAFNNFYKTGGLYTKYGVNDPELNALIDAAEKEPAVTKRLDYYHQIQRMIYDRLYGIVTAEPVGFASWQPWVKGYLMSPGAQVNPHYTPPGTWLDLAQLPEARRNEKRPF